MKRIDGAITKDYILDCMTVEGQLELFKTFQAFIKELPNGLQLELF